MHFAPENRTVFRHNERDFIVRIFAAFDYENSSRQVVGSLQLKGSTISILSYIGETFSPDNRPQFATPGDH